ncbi:MAG: ATP-grasp domain-containing protein [Bacilli bacterium]|nr:ATP-grasp domain-containing protein [Bacilli bacterium]
MEVQEFIPILFGSDRNVYGMAIGFYEQYYIKSIAICKKRYIETRYSKLLEFYQDEKIENKDVFFKVLNNIYDKYKNSKLILIGCSDVYVKLIVENKEVLEKKFIVPYINSSLMNKLIIKENFYKTCNEYNLDYPKTIICTKDNYKTLKLNFDFPIILKPSDSVSYWKASFWGKKKVFIIYSKDELDDILNRIYNSSYKSNLIIQEYIEGDDTALRVLNAYVNSNHKVTFMALGQIVLEDKAPSSYGDYDAIIPTYDQKIFDKMKQFLESINYHGYANFDLKYNAKTKQYKLFEINIRQGRSHSFVTLGGMNITKYLIDDVIYHKETQIEYLNTEYLWTFLPKKIVLKYVKNENIKKKIKEMYKKRKYKNVLYYKKDLTFKRFMELKKIDYNKKYKLYYK